MIRRINFINALVENYEILTKVVGEVKAIDAATDDDVKEETVDKLFSHLVALDKKYHFLSGVDAASRQSVASLTDEVRHQLFCA